METVKIVFNYIKGKKTYAVAAAMVVYAVAGAYLGNMDQSEMMRLLMEAAGMAGLRNAIK